MNRFLNWVNSVGTGQLLFGRNFGRFIIEFKQYWDRAELRSILAPYREEFVTVTKRASRHLTPLAKGLVEELQAALPASATTEEVAKFDIATREFQQGVTDIAAPSVRKPAWLLTNIPGGHCGLLRQLETALPECLAGVAAKALPTFPAKLGAPYWALRDQHETNPWISAEVLNEALRVVSGAQGGRMFLHEWSLNAGDGVLPAELDSAEWDELTALYDGDYCRLAGGATMLGQFIGTMLDPIVGLADTTAASGVFASVAPPVAQEAIQPKRVYTLKQLDEITGWPESTLRNAIRHNELNRHTSTGASNATYMVLGADFLKWQESRSADRVK